MIDVKECIKFCIENFTAEEATERLYKFVNDSLELKEKEIELKYSIEKLEASCKQFTNKKEITFHDLQSTIINIYANNYIPEKGIWEIYVDIDGLKNEDRDKIIDFARNNNRYEFIYQSRNVCKGRFCNAES